MPPNPSSLRNLRIGTDICSIQRIFNILTGRLGKQFASKILVEEERQTSSSKLGALTKWKEYQGRVRETERRKQSWQTGQIRERTLVGGEIVEVKQNGQDFETLEKVFKEEERGLRSELMRTAEFLAGRFAAKEAAIKAHQTRKLTFQDIWIRKQQELAKGNSSAPEAVIKADGSWEKGWIVPISISHDQGFATAVCIADQMESNETVTDSFDAPLVKNFESYDAKELNKLVSDVKRYKMEMEEQLKEIRAMKERIAAGNFGRIPEDISVARRNTIMDTLDVQKSLQPKWIESDPGSLIRKHYTNSPVTPPMLADMHDIENPSYLDPNVAAVMPSNQELIKRESTSNSCPGLATIRKPGNFKTHIAKRDAARLGLEQEMRDEIKREQQVSQDSKEEQTKEEESPYNVKTDYDAEAKISLDDYVFKDEIFATHDVRVARWKATEIEGRLKRTLFVRNIDRMCTPEALQAYFSNSGQAKCQAYIYKTESGDHLGTAAVVYNFTDSARSAQKLFNKTILRGREIEVLPFLPPGRVFAKQSMRLAKKGTERSECGDFDRSQYKAEPLPHHLEHGPNSQYIRVDKISNIGVDSVVRRERGVFIANVAKEATKQDIEELFKHCSSEVDATILHSRNGEFRGVAVVVLKLKEEAKAAREEMRGKVLCGKAIEIKDGTT